MTLQRTPYPPRPPTPAIHPRDALWLAVVILLGHQYFPPELAQGVAVACGALLMRELLRMAGRTVDLGALFVLAALLDDESQIFLTGRQMESPLARRVPKLRAASSPDARRADSEGEEADGSVPNATGSPLPG